MNILMLGWELPPHNSGGLGVACYQMSKALAKAGASIDFVLPYEAEHPESTFMNIHAATSLSPLHRYGMGAYDGMVSVTEQSELPGGVHIREVQARYVEFVTNHLTKELVTSYSAIHAHDWLTFEAGVKAKELTGRPLIAHVHATEFDRAGGNWGDPVVHEIEQQGLMMADRIIAVSNQTKQLIAHRYGIPADKIEVVHNALDTDAMVGYTYDTRTYNYLEELKRQGYTVVATVTRFTIQKGLIHLLRAAARASERYDKLVFLLVGDGEQRDELLRLSAELGIADKVLFTGFVRGKQWRDAFSVADIFVMSSVSEPFGITALEAAHHDNAIILTKQSGASEVLHSVFTYDFWDIDALADRLVGIAASPALHRALQANVHNEYRQLSWHKIAQQCISMYRTLSAGVAR